MSGNSSDSHANVDTLFIQAEHLASDFSLFPEHSPLSSGKRKKEQALPGLMEEHRVKARLKQLNKLDVDSYIAEVVLPAQHSKRPGAKEIISRLNGKIINSQEKGSFYSAEIEIPFTNGVRRIGIIAQERSAANGAWMPEHHLMGSETIRRFSEMSLPIVYFIDTPGADAGELANSNNQAHSISRMITESTAADVPTVGIVVGVGYSGGAIRPSAANYREGPQRSNRQNLRAERSSPLHNRRPEFGPTEDLYWALAPLLLPCLASVLCFHRT